MKKCFLWNHARWVFPFRSWFWICVFWTLPNLAQAPGQRPDPADVLFQSEPSFDIQPPDVKTRPGPSGTFHNSYQGVYEPGQEVWAQVPHKNGHIRLSLPEEKTPSLIAFRVHGPVQGFRFAPAGQPLPGDLDQLVEQILVGSETDAERAMAVFRYVDGNFHQWWFPAEGYQNIRLHSDAVNRQIWGYGYGFCSDVARVAAVLWRIAGLPSRIVGIDPFHTVVEVYYDKGWHLFDVQHRSFWRGKDGAIASAEMLRQQPHLFDQGLDEYGVDRIGYPPMALAYWYQNAQISYHEGLAWETDTVSSLNLREGEFFELNYVGKPYIYHPDFWVQAYGESTLRRDPPWPYSGKIIYAPSNYGAMPEWETILTSDGRTAYVIAMQSPYLITEAYLRLPALAGKGEAFVFAHDRYLYVGPIKANGIRMGKQVAGTYGFAVCLVMDEPLENPQATLADLEMVSHVQVSHIGVPKLRPGVNDWPVDWDSGQPDLKCWFRADGPDLTVSNLPFQEPPVTGQATVLRYLVQNAGSGVSLPTAVSLYNKTTGLFSEAVDLVGQYTVPPLEPGASFILECPWVANTRQTWYGQNPYLQHFEIQIDPDHARSDYDRANQNLTHVVRLRDEKGVLSPLPGYTGYPPAGKTLPPKKTGLWHPSFYHWIERERH